MVKEYVISDMHFFHRNICGEDSFMDTRKQFKDVEEMNEYLIREWNATVRPEDVVYHLGDFSMGAKVNSVVNVLERLNGTIWLIKGNHDNSPLRKAVKNNTSLNSRIHWEDVGIILKRMHKVVHMTHYPLILGDRGNLVNLHGHIHELARPEPNLLNVGVDSPELDNHKLGKPLLLEDALGLVNKKQVNFNKASRAYSIHGDLQ